MERPSNRLRIAHVITRLIRGGADENTILSCNAFAEQGHEVALIFGQEFAGEMVRTTRPEVWTFHIPTLCRSIEPSADAAALLSLRRLLRALRPDIVHTHTSKAGILGRAAAIGLDRTAVIHGIHILPFVNVGAAERYVYLGLERSLARFTDRYVSVSPGMRDIALAHGLGSPETHHVVPSGMNLASFRTVGAGAERRAPANDDAPRPFTVLYLANYEARKRQRELIEALGAAPGRFSDTVFLLAGQGQEQEGLDALVRHRGLQGGVKVLGYVEDVGGLIASADLCLYCSAREGLPRAVVQYCAAGRPTVAFDLPGLDAVLRDGENGRVCPQGNFPALLDGVRDLLDDAPLRARMASCAASADLCAWNAGNMYGSLHDIYRDALRVRARA